MLLLFDFKLYDNIIIIIIEMNVNNSKTASKLQAPSFSSKLRAPTAVAKPLPEPAISENP